MSNASIILIVEDNPDDTRIVARALENFGVGKVFAAETGEEAIQFLAEQPCDVMLIDYNLPGMDGLRLLERTRETWPDVRVILVTGAHDDKVAASAMKLGAADYVPKDELLTSGIVRSLQSCLQRRSPGGVEEPSEAAPTLDGACAEGAWLLASIATVEAPAGAHAQGSLVPEYGGERWSDALATMTSYLLACTQETTDAMDEETGMVRMFIEQGLSPRDVLMLYQASLRGLRTEGAELRWGPAASLARLLARLVEAYQRQTSYAAMEQRGP